MLLSRLDALAAPILAAFRLQPGDAEDVLQDALLKVLECREQIRSLEPWFAQTVRNRCRRLLARRKRLRTVPLESLSGTEGEPQVDPRRSRALEAHELVRRLPHRQAKRLWLFYCEGASAEEIAARTGGSPASVKNQLLRARRAVQRFEAESPAA